MTLSASQFSPAQKATAKTINAFFAANVGPYVGVAACVNAFAESSLRQAVIGDEGTAFGLWQEHWDVRGAIILESTGIDVRNASVEDQCKAILWELQNVETDAMTAIKAATSYADAVARWCQYFERPASKTEPDKRVADVPVFLQILGLSE